jgi:YidC/Oxa1 family membrane protein insertase
MGGSGGFAEMPKGSGSFLQSVREAWRFGKRHPKWRRVVFYSEGRTYAKYLRPIVNELIASGDVFVAYLTSDAQDPILTECDSRLAAFYVGSGSVRTWVFQTLEARILVTTTPDLENLHLKRSSTYPVHYAYVHHSLVSSHRVYRRGAFDHFDSILCAGPHHERETRAWEAINRLSAKRLFEHGYAPLDSLLGGLNKYQNSGTDRLNVLLAPSWGPEGIIERGAKPIVTALLRAGHNVVLRPHPMTSRLGSKALAALATQFRSNPRFSIDVDVTTMQALLDAHILVSDWSGVAMEFAFGLNRPVLFIDGPPKVNNPRWADISCPPVEDIYRSEVGATITLDRLSQIDSLLEELWANRHAYADRAKRSSSEYVYNLGQSSRVGARIIADLARDLDEHGSPT